EARRRLTLVLETLAGRRGVAAACALLGVGESRFHALRARALRAALRGLEPRPAGPPGAPAGGGPPAGEAGRGGRAPRPGRGGAPRQAELEAEVRALRLDRRAARVREELALALPHLLRRPGRPKKTAAGGAGPCGRGRRRT